MRAVRIEEHGGLEVVKLAELPAPRPGPDEVRIAVHAASVNFAEIMMSAVLCHFGVLTDEMEATLARRITMPLQHRNGIHVGDVRPTAAFGG